MMFRLGTLVTSLLVAASVSCGTDQGQRGLDLQPLSDITVQVGVIVTIDLVVDHPEQGLSWSVSCDGGRDITGGRFEETDEGALFTWDPTALDVGVWRCGFTVSSELGVDWEELTIEVLPGAPCSPIFISPPPGMTHNPQDEPCLEMSIEVSDGCSESVEIRQVPPLIEGGEMTATGPYTAIWRWCPTEAQMDETLRYTLYLEADAGVGPPARRSFDIVLRLHPCRDSCPGAPPVIESCSPPPPERLATDDDYLVQCSIIDERPIRSALLYYTTAEPVAPDAPDPSRMNATGMTSVGGDLFQGVIPNFQLSDGEERTLSYLVCATDDDDPEGSAGDHSACSPLYQLIVGPS